MRTLCGWGGRATEVARATESVSKSKILPILENVEKAALFGAQLFANYEL